MSLDFETTSTTPIYSEGTGYPDPGTLDPEILDPLCQPRVNPVIHFTYMNDRTDGTYTISQITFGPACCILLLTSIILIFVIFKHFEELLRLYLSLIFYGVTQLALCLLLAISASVIQMNPNEIKLHSNCNIFNTTQFVVHSLPGFAVLLIAIARWICVTYPIHYRTGRYLNVAPQLFAMIGIVLFVLFLSCLPEMGVCGHAWVNNPNVTRGGYCHLDTRCAKGCDVFKAVFVTFGIFLPILGVCIFYFLIVKVLLKHKKKKESRRSPEQKMPGFWDKSKRILMCGYKQLPKDKDETEDKHGTLKEMKEDRIPWSIIVILVLNIGSNLPLLFSIFAVDMFFDTNRTRFMIVDIVISAQLICIAISPAAYFMTTPAMRIKVLQMFSFTRNIRIPSIRSRSSRSQNPTDESRV